MVRAFALVDVEHKKLMVLVRVLRLKCRVYLSNFCRKSARLIMSAGFAHKSPSFCSSFSVFFFLFFFSFFFFWIFDF